MQQIAESFLWHDYETWGIHPAFNGPAQFAAIRTDSELNEIDQPVMWYCQPPMDSLPQPEACLVTGITPQEALEKGEVEAQFMARIYQQMMQANTCSVGYNSIRFDDEVTRFALYRNFYSVYEREYKNGNSRWDLIDVVRMCAALHPEGIQWPFDEQGVPSFRLEALTAANNIEHQGAHDALVDVRATIALARLIKTAQPEFFHYALSMRDKAQVAKVINLGSGKPILHSSGMLGNANYCTSVLLPLCMHPTNKNAVICFDLRHDPQTLLTLNAEEIARRLFTPASDLQEGERIALKNIHLNKSPMVAPVSRLTEAIAVRINLDFATLRKHFDTLRLNYGPQHETEIIQALDRGFAEQTQDVDAMLYSGGFFSFADQKLIQQVRQSTPQQLEGKSFDFDDKRLATMLFRYRARNFPWSLNEQEQQRWRAHCYERLMQPTTPALLSVDAYRQRIEMLFTEHQHNPQKQRILEELMRWLAQIV